MRPTNVYITIGNYEHALVVDAVITKWDDKRIIQRAEVESISVPPLPDPGETEYRQWVTAVARSAARALEDALMKRVYTHTASEPMQFEDVPEQSSEPPSTIC